MNIVPSESSNLAAHWDRGYLGCSNALSLVYQDSKGVLQYGNLSIGGWVWIPLTASNANMGTNLALDLRLVSSSQRNIVLFYQLSNGDLVPTLFNGSSK